MALFDSYLKLMQYFVCVFGGPKLLVLPRDYGHYILHSRDSNVFHVLTGAWVAEGNSDVTVSTQGPMFVLCQPATPSLVDGSHVGHRSQRHFTLRL
jgi:hypothetical protein